MTKPLTDAQRDALERIRAAVGNMAKLEAKINEAIKANQLPIKGLFTHDLGRLAHDMQGVEFAHEMAEHAARAALNQAEKIPEYAL